MLDSLEKEFEWYLANQKKLVKKHDGKFIALKGLKVIGNYDDRKQALNETEKDHERGTFIIQKCSPGDQDHTIVVHSRVALM